MNVLVINAGSSSVKFGIYANDACLFKQTFAGCSDVSEAIQKIPEIIQAQKERIVVDAVAHRVVHGGDLFRSPCIITADVIEQIQKSSVLAPLHNPSNLAGIRVASACWPSVPQVAVFDTAFHHTIPDYASTYAIPKQWREWGVRRYGFHGTSHEYVMEQVAKALKSRPSALRIISCHLGNGASVCAIDRGQSVDTSMGMSALEGLVMGSRSGDVDPGLYNFLIREKGLDSVEIERILYEESGLRALSGISNDLQAIEQAAAQRNKSAQLALQVFAYRVRKYIGAYAAALNGFDVLAFTGGIGENSAAMRHRICDGFSFLGLHLDFDRNQTLSLADHAPSKNCSQQNNIQGIPGELGWIHCQTSSIKVLALKTQEAWMIASIARNLLRENRKPEPKATVDTMKIPVAVSVRHAHLTQETVEKLFGAGYELTPFRDLSQPGYWAAEETIRVIGPRGEIDRVRILGPCRSQNQIEVSQTETFQLGIDAPVRMSGDLAQTPVVRLVGAAGACETDGVIVARRHIHMNPDDAADHGLVDQQRVSVLIDHSQRDLVFHNVVVRIQPHAKTEMHIDTDEANAADIVHSPEQVRTASGRWATLVSKS